MSRLAIDTSVVVAAFSSWHESHLAAVDLCATEPALPQHALLESYSTLCRMPEPFRSSPQLVSSYLERVWVSRLVGPPTQVVAGLPDRCYRAGLGGGAIYDALIGVTAEAHGFELITLDRRAVLNLRKLNVSVRLLGS
jgi:predicted nucleic acid-binding protein